MKAPDRSQPAAPVFRSDAEIREAAWWAIRVALRKELREAREHEPLGMPRAVPMIWRYPPPAPLPSPVLQAAE